MIFFFGTGTSRLLTAPLLATSCTHCGTTGQLSATVFSRYFSVFWIPVFPIGRISVTVCSHCQQTIPKLQQMPESYRLPVQRLQQQSHAPLSNYVVLLLFALPLAFILIVGLFSGPRPATVAADEPASAVTNSSGEAQADGEAVVGSRYQGIGNADDPTYALTEVVRVTPDTVYFKGTVVLRGSLTPASATIALRDSISPAMRFVAYPLASWRTVVQDKSHFRRIN